MSEHKTLVVVINGRPRAGKDTFVAYTKHHLSIKGYAGASFSSIQPVKDMINNAGIYVGAKTDKDRDLMSEIGDAVEKHSEFRFENCMSQVVSFHLNKSAPGVIFLHIREKHLIDKMENWVKDLPKTQFLKIILKSDRSQNVTSNASDANVDDIIYDHYLFNNGTLADLDATVQDNLKFFTNYL